MPSYFIIIIIGAVILFIFIFYIVYTKHLFNTVFLRQKEISFLDINLDKTPYAPYKDKIRKNIIESEKLEYSELFINSFDGLKLYGKYYNNNSDKTVIFVHGIFAKPHNNFATQIISFYKHKYNMLVIDQRSHGNSEGKYITFAENEAKDVKIWVEKIIQEYNPKSIVLYGTSLGGATVVNYMGLFPNERVKVAIDDCGFESIKSVFKVRLKKNHIPLWTIYPICKLYGRIFAHIHIDKYPPIEAIKQVKKPMIFIHSKNDSIVDFNDGVDLYNNHPGKKIKFFYDNANHTSVFLANEEEIEDQFYSFIEDQLHN